MFAVKGLNLSLKWQHLARTKLTVSTNSGKSIISKYFFIVNIGVPDKKVLLTNGAQLPPVTTGGASAVTRNRPVDFVTASFTTSSSRSSDKNLLWVLSDDQLELVVNLAVTKSTGLFLVTSDYQWKCKWRFKEAIIFVAVYHLLVEFENSSGHVQILMEYITRTPDFSVSLSNVRDSFHPFSLLTMLLLLVLVLLPPILFLFCGCFLLMLLFLLLWLMLLLCCFVVVVVVDAAAAVDAAATVVVAVTSCSCCCCCGCCYYCCLLVCCLCSPLHSLLGMFSQRVDMFQRRYLPRCWYWLLLSVHTRPHWTSVWSW